MYSLGIDIGGTKCAVTLGKDYIPDDPHELVTAKKKFPTKSERGYKAVIDDLVANGGLVITGTGYKMTKVTLE